MLLLITILGNIFLIGCKSKNDRKIKIAEVAHSIFYAPQYIAIENKIFDKYDIEVELLLSSGADKVMSSLLSKDVDIGLMGPEASVYVYNQGKDDYAISFMQLTQKDGSFLVGREKEENFDISKIKDKEIIAGRKGGMPFMTLEYVLNNLGVETKRDDSTSNVNLRTDVQFAAMAGAFISGEGDYVTLFEPTATLLENNNQGYVLDSIGRHAGNIAYTCYASTKSYIDKNEKLLIDFCKAIEEAIDLLYTLDEKDVAKMIHPQFLETSIEDITSVIKRYKDIEAWPRNTMIQETSINKVFDIMKHAKEIEKIPTANEIITNNITKNIKK